MARHTAEDCRCLGLKFTRWAPPYIFDLKEKMTSGTNKLEIKVINTWRNQLIYDNTRPEGEEKTSTTNPPKVSETTLELSGLAGPVILKTIN